MKDINAEFIFNGKKLKLQAYTFLKITGACIFFLLVYVSFRGYNVHEPPNSMQGIKIIPSQKTEKDEKINLFSSKRNFGLNNTQDFHPVNAFQHTRAIGTPENPTLDGGIINAADGIPVVHRTVSPLKIKSDSKAIPLKTAFDDRWVTSARIKHILEQAARTGKLDYILHQSDKKNLPASVALLPVAESAYQSKALSAKGAMGTWQLMPETAKANGITPAQRKEFIPSTQAALHYLYRLHQQFGNWTLVFAAYNAGQGRLMKALQKNPQATSIEALDVPLETKQYVTQLKNITQAMED